MCPLIFRLTDPGGQGPPFSYLCHTLGAHENYLKCTGYLLYARHPFALIGIDQAPRVTPVDVAGLQRKEVTMC